MNIYYRIYKLYQRNIPIQQISVTTHIPAKVIKELVNRFEAKGAINDENELNNIVEPFLDYIISKFHRHIMLDFSGMLKGEFADKIKAALEETRKMPGQVLAIKLESIMEIDDAGVKPIYEFKDQIEESSGKYIVFLSPSDAVEEYIEAHKVDEKIKIFGTQNAFEEYVFKHQSGITKGIPTVKK
ncbi:MAG: hypothetical protein FWF51_01155 [Chitinivibrionia bacterium]|jgi:ABC-type transporter Mla MlaB component|nr:hypothetical protein [Chitinivibrionia bacterium]